MGGSADLDVVSPMPGRVVKVFVTEGQEVKAGDTLIAVESMKMEYAVKAKGDGKVARLLVAEDAQVEMKQKLVILE